MDKIKEGLASLWAYIVLGLGAILAIVLYILNLKNKELEAAKAKIALVQTQKQADAIETEIKQQMAEKDLNQKQMDGLQQSLDLLEQKRQTLKQEGDLTDKQVEDFWNKK